MRLIRETVNPDFYLLLRWLRLRWYRRRHPPRARAVESHEVSLAVAQQSLDMGALGQQQAMWAARSMANDPDRARLQAEGMRNAADKRGFSADTLLRNVEIHAARYESPLVASGTRRWYASYLTDMHGVELLLTWFPEGSLLNPFDKIVIRGVIPSDLACNLRPKIKSMCAELEAQAVRPSPE